MSDTVELAKASLEREKEILSRGMPINIRRFEFLFAKFVLAQDEEITRLTTERDALRDQLTGCHQTEAAMLARVEDLQTERDELRAMLSEVIYHTTHSMDCKHGDGFTYDFCPVAKARELAKGGEA